MGTYRLWPSVNGPASVASDNTAYTLGTEFYVTGMINLTGYWWWCAPGADTSPKTFGLWTVVTTLLGSPVAGAGAVSGVLVQGSWNYAALDTPLALTTNQRYRAGVLGNSGTNWYSATPNGWPADITNGPLTAPSTANAIGGIQSGFTTSTVLAYPKDSAGSNYWVDVQVTDAAAPPTSARSTVRGREAATSASGRTGTALVKGREPISSTGGEAP